jgi:hypothetical protein
MDLTVGVSNALLSSGLLPLENDHILIQRKSNTLKLYPRENIYEELKTPLSTLTHNNKAQVIKVKSNDPSFRTPTMKIKGNHHLQHSFHHGIFSIVLNVCFHYLYPNNH